MSSSGLGTDAILESFKNNKKFFENIYVISNSFEWDKNGKAIGIKKPIIHSMNKDDTMLKDFPFFNMVKDRKNVILMGDGLGDVGMIKGFNYRNLIKVGFLNEKAEELLEEYKKNFDVVILNDGPLSFVNELLRKIACFNKSKKRK